MGKYGYVQRIDNTTVTTEITVKRDRLAEEVALADNYTRDAIASGVTEQRFRYWAGWWGRCALQKEVGPPPWRFPKAFINVAMSEKRHPCIRVGIGWRMTLYTAMYMAYSHREG